ncbi:MAG: hypothetical protein L0Y54_02835 [Sporichthyaceae bacterium]|nr:hypothetical protein [Sporichthyaceae bacterium]
MQAQEPSHAEVDQIWVEADRVRVGGELPDGAGSPAVALRLACRERPDVQLQLPASTAAGRFEVVIPTGSVAAATKLPTETWDLYLCVGELAPIRVGRHRDDIRNKKRIMTFPARRAGIGRHACRVRIGYTIKNNLSITSTRLLAPIKQVGPARPTDSGPTDSGPTGSGPTGSGPTSPADAA